MHVRDYRRSCRSPWRYSRLLRILRAFLLHLTSHAIDPLHRQRVALPDISRPRAGACRTRAGDRDGNAHVAGPPAQGGEAHGPVGICAHHSGMQWRRAARQGPAAIALAMSSVPVGQSGLMQLGATPSDCPLSPQCALAGCVSEALTGFFAVLERYSIGDLVRHSPNAARGPLALTGRS